MDYKTFIEAKLKHSHSSGFQINESFLHSTLFDFQKYLVRTALSHGKYAIFSECGTGKTLMQVEWAKWIHSHSGENVIIFCPLAVSAQTIEEAKDKLNVDVSRYDEQSPIQIVNYDQVENINPDLFGGVVLDESSILKNVDGATKKKLIEGFRNHKYKLCCTATPSPNDDMEMCNHAEFLNQGRRDEILATYFTHDGGETAKWRLKGHAVKKFWNYVKSWSSFVSNPADIGFDGSKFILPKLNLIEKVINVPAKSGMLFNNININATNFNQELRDTMQSRLDEVINIVNTSEDNFIIWIKQNVEAEYLLSRIDATEVRGSDTTESKEKKLLDFAHNKFRVLITKTKIAQFGMNFQNCHNQVFASMDFSFEGTYQAIRRSYRFGQKHEVNIYLITTDTMQNVMQAIKNKQNQFEDMKKHLIQQYA